MNSSLLLPLGHRHGERLPFLGPDITHVTQYPPDEELIEEMEILLDDDDEILLLDDEDDCFEKIL